MDFERTRFLIGEVCAACGNTIAVTEEGFAKPDGRLSWTEIDRVCQGRCTTGPGSGEDRP